MWFRRGWEEGRRKGRGRRFFQEWLRENKRFDPRRWVVGQGFPGHNVGHLIGVPMWAWVHHLGFYL